MAKRGGLGRGLDVLFQDTGSGGGEENATTLPLSEIEPDKEQPRKKFDDEALNELASSIAEHGVLQPIVVRPSPPGGYHIVAGERRWRAARMAGLTEIPVVIREITDAQAMEIALIENLQREDLDPVEEAMGYKQLMERCGYTQEAAASRLSKSRSAVANSLRLLNLPQIVLAVLRTGQLSAGHAKAILSLPDASAQEAAATAIIQDGMNVRQAEAYCKKMMKEPRARKEIVRPPLPSEVELSLREALGTEIHVQYKNGKGSLQVSFYSDDQLKAFANLLGKYEKEGK